MVKCSKAGSVEGWAGVYVHNYILQNTLLPVASIIQRCPWSPQPPRNPPSRITYFYVSFRASGEVVSEVGNLGLSFCCNSDFSPSL